MALLNLQGGNKWIAESVHDVALDKSQAEINADAESALQPEDVEVNTLNALAALFIAGNNGKVIGVVNGSPAAVEGGASLPDGDEVSY